MDMMAIRRRVLLGQKKSDELYPIGCDIIAKYYGRKANGQFIGETNVNINSKGEFVSGNSYGNPTYLPINPDYRYKKSAQRMYNLTYYDENYAFIKQESGIAYNNLREMEITNVPVNASYIRFVSHGTAYNNWLITITRIA